MSDPQAEQPSPSEEPGDARPVDSAEAVGTEPAATPEPPTGPEKTVQPGTAGTQPANVASWPPPQPSAVHGASGVPTGPVPAMAPPAPMPGGPVVAPPRPAGPFRHGFGLGAGAGLGLAVAVLAIGIVGALLSALTLVIVPLRTGAATTSLQTIWGSPTAKYTLRAFPITGTILADTSDGAGLTVGTYGYEVARTIDDLTADDADGIVLLMNTPGGSITGSRAIADAVDRYRARTGKKVFAHVEGMSASGGMYTMANADRIVADHGSLVGSIGVISGPFARYKDVTGTTGTLLESGVTTTGGVTYEYLSMGRDKDFGSPYRDMTPEERQVWMTGLAVEYDAFVSWVSQHRDIPADTIKNSYGAHMFDSQTAVTTKYVDAVGGRDEAFREFAGLAGIDPADTRVEQQATPGLLATLLGVEARVPGVAPAVTAEGGQAARVSARMCSGAPQVLAYQGDVGGFCG
ncbi:S49 family peptidase [Raineyella sp. LH-20]|uniref:S49 family peptidase n=1 Tax=Raineyella sp. LH-20 TaxID=3081204 RepID=UPI0029545696|nr:S49 family peptidase [Raineyella sp. LH-20]WOP18644.1 S49 family peptidase [Raineyella sp. LH-20]